MPPSVCALPVLTLRQRLCIGVVATGLLIAMLASPARADELADVSKLMRSGQYGDALSKADAFLTSKPRDPQMRFLKGVILTEQNKTPEAITVFSRLTKDFPELPEPYNNLAVLYAGSGQYEKARAALDKAIRTNPTYATAYENLGDIHAKLASEAYDKALQLDSGNSGAKSKLTMVRSLVSVATTAGTRSAQANPATATATAPSPPKPAPMPPVAVAPAPPAALPASPGPAPRIVAPTPATTLPTPAATQPVIPPLARLEPPASVARTEAKARPEAKVETRPAAADNADRDAVLASVHGWASAWSARDVKTYLNHYGPEFQPPKGMSRKAWSEERESRIAGKGRINVKVETPQVHVDGNTATVKFRQAYSSDRLSSTSRKTLVLVKNHGKWQIRSETTGS
ncbi:MAG: tetratricopeptide repeat protein [Herminiimonas sp.]|nr:tetratricopeptide repeat protein [Herminiimonas sp.]